MNSILQCLLYISKLSFYFFNAYEEFNKTNNNNIKNTETKGKISEQYFNILINIFDEPKRNNNDSFNPKKFVDLIDKLAPQFSKDESNKYKDLIIYLLQNLHEELNYFERKRLDKSQNLIYRKLRLLITFMK